MTLGNKIIAGFAGPLIVLLVVAGVAGWTTYRLIDTAWWVDHTHQVLENLEALRSTLKEAETSQRFFLLTDNNSYIASYKTAHENWKKPFDALADLTKVNKVQKELLDELKPLVESKFAELDQAIELRRKQPKGPLGADAVLELVNSDAGKTDRDKIHELIQAMDGEARTLLTQRDVEARTSALVAYWSLGLGTLVAVGLVFLLGLMVVRSVHPVRDAINLLKTASSEILATATQQASGAREQAVAVTETVATVDEVTQTSDQATQRAKGLGEAVMRTVQIGQAGRKAAADSIAALAKVQDQVEATAENILALAEQAQAIGEITAAVADVAEQTNLLALNAAIEASRAGEHGKGFAVVAGEVKALADQSKKATAQVRQILGEIQKGTNAAVLSTEDVTKGVVSASRVADQAGQTIKALAETLAEAAQAASQITASAGQQATGMAQIHQAMRNIDETARQNLAALSQAEQAARNLNNLGSQFTQIFGN